MDIPGAKSNPGTVTPMRPTLDALKTTSLLTETREFFLGRFGAVFQTMLGKMDDSLFDYLHGSGVLAEQNQYFDALRELRLKRERVEKRLRAHLVAAFDALVAKQPMDADQALARHRNADSADGELCLVSEDELEGELGAKMLAAALQREHGSVLNHLDQRLGVLTGLSLEPGQSPLGGGHVAVGVYMSLGQCELTLNARLLLLKLAERELLPQLQPIYSALDRRLAEAGVIPRMRALPPRNPAAAIPPRASRTSQAASLDGDNTVAHEGHDGWRGDPIDANEQILMATLQHLLQSNRQQRYGPPPPTTGDTRPLSHHEIISLLSLLQAELPESMRAVVQDPTQSLGHRLRHELLAGARSFGVEAGSTHLSQPDEDAVDLVGMLFDVLLDERELSPSVRAMIGQLVVPLVKVAVLDRRMFLRKTHPARRLLNALVEACEGNRGDAPQEQVLLDKVNETVDRLMAGFNEDISIFEVLEEEFSAFIEQHRRRVSIAERRTAESVRGRERLETARARASAELEARLVGRELPASIDSLLNNYWTHHLTVLGSREGVDSPGFQQALHHGDSLIHCAAAVAEGVAAVERILPDLRIAVLPMLSSVGCSGTPADEVVNAVADELLALARGEAAAEEAATLPQMPEVVAPAPKDEEPDAPLRLVADRDTLDFDPVVAGQMRGLAIGAWVEFVDEQGQGQPAKLSWISPISSRLLFVNRRGARTCVASAEELAAMVRAGKLRLRAEDSAFEHAMQQVLGRLRGGSQGRTPAA